jgi:hypothetical protein
MYDGVAGYADPSAASRQALACLEAEATLRGAPAIGRPARGRDLTADARLLRNAFKDPLARNLIVRTADLLETPRRPVQTTYAQVRPLLRGRGSALRREGDRR